MAQTWNPIRANFSGSNSASYAASRALAGMTNSANNIHRGIVADAAAEDAKNRQARLDAQRQQELDYQHGRQQILDTRAKAEWDQKQGDRTATQKYYSILDGTAASTIDQANNPLIQAHVKDASLTQAENEMLSGVKGTGLDLSKPDAAKKILLGAGYDSGEVQGLLDKYGRATVLSNQLGTIDKTKLLHQTRGELSAAGIKYLQDHNMAIPKDVRTKAEAVRAAEVSAKALDEKNIRAQMTATTKELDQLNRDKAKILAKGTGYSRGGGRSGYRGKSYVSSKTTVKQKLSDAQDLVTKWGLKSVIGLPTDAGQIQTWYDTMVSGGGDPSKAISPDKAIYIIDNSINHEATGNTVDTDKASVIGLAKQYDKVFSKSHYKGKKGNMTEFNTIVANKTAELAALRDRLNSRSSSTLYDQRQNKLKDILGTLHVDSKKVPDKVDEFGQSVAGNAAAELRMLQQSDQRYKDEQSSNQGGSQGTARSRFDVLYKKGDKTKKDWADLNRIAKQLDSAGGVAETKPTTSVLGGYSKAPSAPSMVSTPLPNNPKPGYKVLEDQIGGFLHTTGQILSPALDMAKQSYYGLKHVINDPKPSPLRAGLAVANNTAAGMIQIAGSPYTAVKMATDWLMTGKSNGSKFDKMAEDARTSAVRELANAGVTDPTTQQVIMTMSDMLAPGGAGKAVKPFVKGARGVLATDGLGAELKAADKAARKLVKKSAKKAARNDALLARKARQAGIAERRAEDAKIEIERLRQAQRKIYEKRGSKPLTDGNEAELNRLDKQIKDLHQFIK